MVTKDAFIINSSISGINRMAREARLICNDIIRQTSLTPYYGKRGGAAMYAADDNSEVQRRRVAQALAKMKQATAILREIAIAGGMTEAKIVEDMRDDARRTETTTIDDSEL